MQFFEILRLYIYVRRENRYIYMSDNTIPLVSLLNNRYSVSAPKRVEQGEQTQATRQTEFTPTVDYSSRNLFSGNLSGVNTNIGIGDYQDGPVQAGRKLGGRTLAFG